MKVNVELLKTWAFWKTILFLPFLIYFTITIIQTFFGMIYNLIFNLYEFDINNYIVGIIFILAMPGINYSVTGLIKNLYASSGVVFPDRDISEEEFIEEIKKYGGDNGV